MSRFWIQAAAMSVLTATGASAWAATLDIDPGIHHLSEDGATWYYGNIVSDDGTISLPNTSNGGLDFWLHTPDGYDFTNPGSTKYPLVIFLHGAGKRRSSTTEHLDLNPLQYWVRDDVQALAPNGGAFVFAPKITSSSLKWVNVGNSNNDFYVADYSADATPVADTLRLALTAVSGLVSGGDSDFKTMIDPSRIYIVGQSMGGFGAWDAAARLSNAAGRAELADWLANEQAHGGQMWSLFDLAAAMPIAGAAPNDRAQELASLAIWAMAHTHDDTVPTDGTLNAMDLIESILGPGGVYHTTNVTADSNGNLVPISEPIESLLLAKWIETLYTGSLYSHGYTDAHSWIAQTWHLAGMSELDIARWLFAQVGYVPEPGTVVLLAAGLGATLLRRRQNRS